MITLINADVIKRSEKRKKKCALHAKSQGSTTKFAREQRAEKSCKQVALCISRRMRNTSNQLFPKRSDERAREFSYRRGKREREKRADKEKTGSTNAPKVRSSRLPLDVAVATSLLTASPHPSFFSVVSHISSRAFRPEVISYLYADAKNSSGKSDEASSFRSRVTNHLSRGARFRSTSKRGEW